MKRRPTAVQAEFSVDGEIEPQQFEWRGVFVMIEGLGRCWTEADERCFNVVAMGGRLFELRLDLETMCWSVARGPQPGLMV